MLSLDSHTSPSSLPSPTLTAADLFPMSVTSLSQDWHINEIITRDTLGRWKTQYVSMKFERGEDSIREGLGKILPPVMNHWI